MAFFAISAGPNFPWSFMACLSRMELAFALLTIGTCFAYRSDREEGLTAFPSRNLQEDYRLINQPGTLFNLESTETRLSRSRRRSHMATPHSLFAEAFAAFIERVLRHLYLGFERALDLHISGRPSFCLSKVL